MIPPPLEDPLRKSRFTEEQIILALKQHEAGRGVDPACFDALADFALQPDPGAGHGGKASRCRAYRVAFFVWSWKVSGTNHMLDF